MTDSKAEVAARLEQALSRWDTEGGAGPRGPQDSSVPGGAMPAAPPLPERPDRARSGDDAVRGHVENEEKTAAALPGR